MPSNEELDELIQNILKQKELIEAQKALDEAKKTADVQLEQVQKTSEIVAQQKTIAENQKAVAEARRDAILASFPKGTTTPLEGDITTNEKFGYITKIVAYETVKKNAIKIANSINIAIKKRETTGGQSRILIVSDLDVASGDVPLLQVESVLDLFKESMTSQKEKNAAFLEKSKKEPEMKFVAFAAAALAPMVISGIISSIADIMGYFQVDYDIKGQDFTLDNQALVSIVANGLENPVCIYNFNITKNSELLQNFRNVLNLKVDLDKAADEIKVIIEKKKDEVKSKKDETERLNKRLKELKDTAADKEEKTRINEKLATIKDALDQVNKFLDTANSHVANSETISKAFTVFADSITKTEEGNNLPLLAKAVLRKHIHADDIKYLLNLKIVSGGGEAITMKRRIPWGKDNSSFIGGSVVSFILADTDGKIVAADTIPGLARIGYQLSGGKEPNFNEISIPEYPYPYKKTLELEK
jgi:hypothetical protein